MDYVEAPVALDDGLPTTAGPSDRLQQGGQIHDFAMDVGLHRSEAILSSPRSDDLRRAERTPAGANGYRYLKRSF